MKRSARMKNLAINIEGVASLGVLSFSFTPDTKYELKDAFPKGICAEGKGRCCWKYSQLAWDMPYGSRLTRIKSDKTGNYYRTCFSCDNERWVENPNPDNWYACDENW